MLANTERTRQRSAAIFGNEKVVEVVLALNDTGESPTATAQDLSRATGIAHPMVRDVLRRLALGEVLIAAPKVGGSRSAQYYHPRPGAAWDAVVSLAEAIASETASTRAAG